MKFLSYKYRETECFGFFRNGRIFSLHALDARLPATIDLFLLRWAELLPLARKAGERIMTEADAGNPGLAPAEVQVLAPVPRPPSCRDAYAFRRHVETARKNRHLAMIPEFDRFPVFYFTNHHAICGPGVITCMPDHFNQLDYELEAAVVITKGGRNIRAEEADSYIGGMMIMNDLSARKLQLDEMKLNLGPAKGKDFATATGPWLVTMDELEPFETPCAEGHTGKSWNLSMTCSVNRKELSRGSLSEMQWTFAEIIERASYGVNLYPGDLIGSGTVGTGCLLELNGTASLKDPGYTPQWLQDGDEVEMMVKGLGILKNTVVRDSDFFSILPDE